MADILHECRQCGRRLAISEFVPEADRKCPICGSALTALAEPPRSDAARAELHVRQTAPKTSLNGELIAPHTEGITAAPLPGGLRKYAVTGVPRTSVFSSAGFAWLLFLALSAGIVAAVQGARGDTQWQPYYLQARWAVVAIPALLVCLEAFRESAGQGLLCLFIPFYLLWYGLTRVESYWRQALLMGAIVLLGAEYYWLREKSILIEVSKHVDALVVGVDRAIRRAGEAPID